MPDRPSADQPDPIAPPDNPEQPLRGPQWARKALANQHDPATRARQVAALPMTDFEGSGFIRRDGDEVREAVVVDEDRENDERFDADHDEEVDR